MKTKLIRVMSLILALAAVLPLIGCQKKVSYDGQAVLESVLQQVKFEDTLESAGDMAELYFSELPEGTQVQLYVGGGYFADEVALLTLKDKKDQAAALAAVNAHLAELKDQFSKYVPAEVGKIEKAVIWQEENYLIFVVTADHANAKLIFDNAANPDYKLPGGNQPTTTPTTVPSDPTVPTTSVPTDPTVPPTSAPTEPSDPGSSGGEQQGAGFSTCIGIDPVTGYPILKSLSGTFQNYGGLIRVDNRVMELIGYSDKNSSSYAALVSKVADQLVGTSKVYSLPIPTAIGIMMPDDVKISYKNQGDSIDKILAKMSSNVIGVDVYDNMMKHRDEYLYFRTDHHWNGIGAYYAYEVFCQVKGVSPYTMEQREEVTFGNFLGSLYRNESVNKDPKLLPADTVYAYKPYSKNASMTFYDNDGNGTKWPIIKDVTNYKEGSKYLTFAGGDQPLAILKNPDVTDGSVCIVIKESYGNALLPLVVDHYSEVHEIDYRHWKGDLVAYAKEIGADDVLFANNLSMIGSSLLIGKLAKIIPA